MLEDDILDEKYNDNELYQSMKHVYEKLKSDKESISPNMKEHIDKEIKNMFEQYKEWIKKK